MVRFKLLLSALCFVLLGQSCVHGGLDDCPPMVTYAVAFNYTSHAEIIDRFYDDVKKIELYVFDENSLVYTTATAVSPYEKNFNIPLDLPMGNYHILAWGNTLDSEPFDITPSPFVKGKTSLSEARLTLQKTANELNNTKLENLFFGEIHAEIPLYVSRIDTIPLINNTKNVRVVLHWDFSDAPAGTIIDHSNVVVRLNGKNEKYKFDNSNDGIGVSYAPYATCMTGDTLRGSLYDWFSISYYNKSRFGEITESRVYDFTILRLFKDLPIYAAIDYMYPMGKDQFGNEQYSKIKIHEVDIASKTDGFGRLFTDKQIAEPLWQRTFDFNHFYRVDIYIVQDGFDTFVTGGINILDWQKVEDNTGGGAN